MDKQAMNDGLTRRSLVTSLGIGSAALACLVERRGGAQRDELARPVGERDAIGQRRRRSRALRSNLDHRNLNEVPPFDRLNPSSENLARHIFQTLAPLLAAYPVRLVSVTVCEKPGQCASYSPTGTF